MGHIKLYTFCQLNIRESTMSKFNHILFFGFLLSVLSACNANTKVEISAADSTAVNTSKKEVVNAKSAASYSSTWWV